MKVVVTGGAGFIGANLCRALTRDPLIDEVVVLDDLSTGYAANLEAVPVELIEGSILDPDTLDKCLSGADAIVHLAARPSVPRSLADPIASHRVNASGTIEMLEAARRAGGPHVVLASSSSVYGANPALPKTEDLATFPLSPYAASKLASESYALAYQHSFDLPVLAFRFFNVFGPWQSAGHAYAAVIPAFVTAALSGKPLPVRGDGYQSRDFTFVDTVTSVICRAISRQVTSHHAINLAYGNRISLTTLIDLLSSILGRRLEIDHQPERLGDVQHSQASNAHLTNLFPDVEPVDIVDGLRKTVQWFREEIDK